MPFTPANTMVIEGGGGKDDGVVVPEKSSKLRRNYFRICSNSSFSWRRKDLNENSTAISSEYSIANQKLATHIATDANWLSDKEPKVDQNSTRKQSQIRKYISKCFCALMVILGLALYIADPYEEILDFSMKISPGSRMLNIWMDPPISVYASAYVFNITNPQEVLEGKEKIKVQQIGPFVYKEELRNTKVRFNGNGTMTYSPKRTATFVRDRSVADPKDLHVTVPNIALLGLGSMLSTGPILASIGVMGPLQFFNNPPPFLNLSLYDYFWGYKDDLVSAAYVMSIVPFQKLGLLDRMYDEGENEVTIRLEDNGLDMLEPGYLPQYSIETMNGSPGNKPWGYDPFDFRDREEPLSPEPEERCKLLRGVTEGILFPRNLNRKMKSYIYRKTFCRSMRIDFKHEGSFAPGINADWYGMPDDAFDTADVNPEQKCYCNPDSESCLPKGLADITPCYYRIPAAVSNPHFLGADPSLLNGVDGLSPNEENHGSTLIMQPEMGSVLSFCSRIQTNLVIKDTQYNQKLSPFANLTIPLFWVELKDGGLGFEVMAGLYFLLVILPASMLLIKILGVLSALYLVLTVCCHVYRRLHARQSSADSTPTLISAISKDTSASS